MGYFIFWDVKSKIPDFFYLRNAKIKIEFLQKLEVEFEIHEGRNIQIFLVTISII